MQSSKRIVFPYRTPTAQTLPFTGWRWFRFHIFHFIYSWIQVLTLSLFSWSSLSSTSQWTHLHPHFLGRTSQNGLITHSPVTWWAVLATCWRGFRSQSTNAPKLGSEKMIDGRFCFIRPFSAFKVVLDLCTHLLWNWIIYLLRGSVMNSKFINCAFYHISYSHFQNFVDFALNTILLNWDPTLCFCLYLSWGLFCHSFDFMFSSSFCIKCVSPK